MSTSVFTNGIDPPLPSPGSPVAPDGAARALAPEPAPELLDIVGDRDQESEGSAEQQGGDGVPELEQPEPTVLEPADPAHTGIAPSERLIGEVQPVRGDDHDQHHGEEPQEHGDQHGLGPGPF